MSAGQLARHRSTSSSTRPSYRAATPIDTRISEEVDFEPCAATASIFLYAQGNAILCLHHDTLAIERRFELHKERVLFIAVDNVIGYAGVANHGWGFAHMERFEAAYGRVAQDNTYLEEEGQYRARATLVRVVKERESLAIIRRARSFYLLPSSEWDDLFDSLTFNAGRRSKGSRLRQEVLRSPEKEYIDLFPRTKMRLSNIAYQQQPQPLDQENLTPDECRRRMLEVVFGWEDDIEALIRDELHYHRQGSQSGVLLAKWLGDVDSDMMAAAISSDLEKEKEKEKDRSRQTKATIDEDKTATATEAPPLLLTSASGLSTGGLSTGRSDYLSDTKSPSISGHSWASAKSPSISGRSIDQYISSLEEAGYHQKKKNPSSRRHKSREGREHKARSKGRVGDRSADRGRDERKKIRPAKRSPSSPKPMSPETYIDPMSGEHLDDRIRSPISEGRHLRDTPKTAHKFRSGSKASNYSHHTDRTVVRHRSPEAAYDRLGIDSGFRSGKSSRQQSPQGLFDSNGRGRSKSKNGGSQVRSPSSPLPMSPQADYYRGSDEDEDPLRIVEANRQRLRSRHRSRSRRPRERNTSSRRDMSTDRRREDQYLRTGETDELRPTVEPRRTSGDMLLSAAQQPKLHRQISERTQKKELAARELEARRESLLRNPEAPPILHPDEYSGRPNLQYRAQTSPSNSPTSWDPVLPSHHSQRFPENHGDFINRAGAASVGPYGLPATPRAMRHPRYDNKANDIPAVPEIPEGVQPLPETYYTGQPTFELPRSMSAPIPEPQYTHRPEELPSHPAFHKGLRPGKRNNFSPLNDIGSNRRRPSDDANIMSRVQDTNSIAGVLASADSGVQIISIEEPPLLPELQHLQQQGFPPPPPPPPAPFAHNGTDAESSSLSSNSNVGVISMVLDNEPGDESNVIEVPPPPPPVVQSVRSPPMGTTGSPPPSMNGSGSNHRRGRSENFKNGFSVKGITDRLRSTSRGRNTKSPEHKTPAPYESVPPLYF
ncbi:hypothetical protein P7C71_g1726, partial [Lecanoromycetidae sp. Uapishka_2]